MGPATRVRLVQFKDDVGMEEVVGIEGVEAEDENAGASHTLGLRANSVCEVAVSRQRGTTEHAHRCRQHRCR